MGARVAAVARGASRRHRGGRQGARVGRIPLAGFDRIGYRQQIGLVGSYEDVAQALSRYREDGVEVFVLTGHPHLEELHRVGEHLLHLVDPAGRTLAGQEISA